MIEFTKLSQDVQNDLIQFCEEDGDTFEEAKQRAVELCNTSSIKEVLDAYLNWNGIIGYTQTILDAIESIDKAEIKQLPKGFFRTGQQNG